MNPVEFEFTSLRNGTCLLTKITLNEEVETLELPGVSPDGETVVGAYQINPGYSRDENTPFEGKSDSIRTIWIPASYRKIITDFWRLSGLIAWQVDPENPNYEAVDGLLYTKNRETLLSCPVGKEGTIHIPEGTIAIGDQAFVASLIFKRVMVPKSVQSIGREAFSFARIDVYIPGDVADIHKEAFEEDEWGIRPSIYAPRNSSVHRFAETHNVLFVPWENLPVWDHAGWRNAFDNASVYEERRALRRRVWQDTLNVVKNVGYNLQDGRTVALHLKHITKYGTRFYSHAFHAACFPVKEPTEIRVVPDDCLDTAHAWVDEGLEVCVLNMANRHNPGGGVASGAGAQEEYLFRCSDYFRSLYRYAPYAGQYGLDHAGHSYPMDRDFGGIYSPAVTVFRGNEAGGYAYLEKPFRVNMIAVAGINSPELVYDEHGETRIAPRLVESVKNKIRTIFRIAQDNGQRCLVLGALGCGAFRNPPGHVAELFREVLCEDEFDHAFRRVTFAVKTDHHSNGNSNFDAFYRVLNGFVPAVNPETVEERVTNIRKIAVSRDDVALLRDDGSVRCINLDRGTECIPEHLYHLTDIAAGFKAIFGLRRSGKIRVWNAELDDEYASHHPFSHGVYLGCRIFASEGHMAVLMPDGRVTNAEGDVFEPYAHELRSWHDIKDLSLACSMALGLCMDGTVVATTFYAGGMDRPHPFVGKKAMAIAANDVYYGTMTAAMMQEDGTVIAYLNNERMAGTEAWRNIVKIDCCDSAVFALDQQHILHIRNRITEINIADVCDFFCGPMGAVIMDGYGRLRYLDRNGEEA